MRRLQRYSRPTTQFLTSVRTRKAKLKFSIVRLLTIQRMALPACHRMWLYFPIILPQLLFPYWRFSRGQVASAEHIWAFWQLLVGSGSNSHRHRRQPENQLFLSIENEHTCALIGPLHSETPTKPWRTLCHYVQLHIRSFYLVGRSQSLYAQSVYSAWF